MRRTPGAAAGLCGRPCNRLATRPRRLPDCRHGRERGVCGIEAGLAAAGGRPAGGPRPRAQPGRPAGRADGCQPQPGRGGDPGPADAALAAGPLRAARRQRSAPGLAAGIAAVVAAAGRVRLCRPIAGGAARHLLGGRPGQPGPGDLDDARQRGGQRPHQRARARGGVAQAAVRCRHREPGVLSPGAARPAIRRAGGVPALPAVRPRHQRPRPGVGPDRGGHAHRPPAVLGAGAQRAAARPPVGPAVHRVRLPAFARADERHGAARPRPAAPRNHRRRGRRPGAGPRLLPARSDPDRRGRRRRLARGRRRRLHRLDRPAAERRQGALPHLLRLHRPASRPRPFRPGRPSPPDSGSPPGRPRPEAESAA
jgi:hypothetical protein